jgi:hypothetical protein
MAAWICAVPIPVCPTITETITRIAIEENFDPIVAIRIAKCESQLGKYRKNFEGSSATGLYMFMPLTFSHYCEGNIESDIDQIKCFMRQYKKHPGWWECA